MSARAIPGWAAGAAALMLCGCASQTPRAAIDSPGSAGPWDVVLSGPGGAPGPELARLDASMNIREVRPLLAIDAWPQEPLPTLERTGRVFLPRRPEHVLYFRRPGVIRHRWGHEWWRWPR